MEQPESSSKAQKQQKEPVSSSDVNKGAGKASDSQREETKHGSNTEDLLLRMNSSENKPQRYAWQIKLDEYIEGLGFQLFFSFLSLFALFADEIRVLGFSKPADDVFYTLLCITMGLFVVEIVLCCIAKDDYFNGFFFWLDVISTVSIIGDIAWIVPETSQAAQAATGVAKQARAARAVRVVRLIRLIRLIRITKLYKEVQKQRDGKESGPMLRRGSTSRIHPTTTEQPPIEDTTRGLAQKEPQELKRTNTGSQHGDTSVVSSHPEVPKESRISKILTDITTQRVVLLVITLTFCLPLLSLGSYIENFYISPYAVTVLAESHSKMTPTEFDKLCQKFCDETKEDTHYPLIYVSGPGCGPYIFDTNENDLRISEKIEAEHEGYRVVFDMRSYTKLNAGLGIARTFFLCFVLAIGALLFYNDTNTLVLEPLESMMEKVNKLATDPMWFCLALDDDNLGIYSMFEKNKEKDEKYETQYLEALIVKIAKLLAVEFGEAGTKIIVANLTNNDFLNPMVPGSKMTAIFGFCLINSFAETTDRLQTKIIMYLNQIAEIVHSVVDKYMGSTNKNIGAAFLVLWKFREDDVEITPNGPVTRTRVGTATVDLALFAYLKIIAKVNKLRHILDYEDIPEIKEKDPGYKLKMSFGLHAGWGIEGAIGSIHKIDASYLSPNVNISARLESAAEQYGVPVLISGQVYSMLSPFVQKYCREIDTVTVKGSAFPVKLYTVDVNVEALTPKECKYASISYDKRREKRLRKRKQLHSDIIKGLKTTSAIYSADKDLAIMRASISEAFIKQHEEGYKNYIEGNWNQATEIFRNALALVPHDEPTITLLKYMDARGGIAPATWKGYRELTEK